MENVGCVLFREGFLPKDTPNQIQLTRVCQCLMHEMAHMWFGNLVTMKWWNDLWLNESFAEYISHYAISKEFPDEFRDIWTYFLADKSWGYDTDQNKTTHPIQVEINDTEEADTIFDGISYSKGAAVLK
jgi:aminopeptidase N